MKRRRRHAIMLIVALMAIAGSLRLGGQAPAVLIEELRVVSDESSEPTALTAISKLLVTGSGEIFTSHARERRIRRFDSTGRFVAVWGSQGQGPGEFGTLGDIRVVDSTLLAMDVRGRRANRFDLSGSFLGSSPVAREPGSLAVTYEFVDNGIVLSTSVGLDTTADGSSLQRSSLTTLDGSASTSLGFWERADVERVRVTEASGRTRTMLPPVTDVTMLLVSPDKPSLALVESSGRFGGKPGSVRVIRVTERGVPFDTSVVELDARRVGTAWFDAEVSRIGSTAPALLPAYRRLAPRPDYFPAFRMALYGMDGTIWLQDYERRESWVAISDTGELLWRVNLAANQRLRQAGRSKVYVSQADSLGVPMLVGYAIAPGSELRAAKGR